MSSTLSRAQSWPLLVPSIAIVNDANVNNNNNNENTSGAVGVGAIIPGEQQVVNPNSSPKNDGETRRLLRRHYYPEGGWGWVVVTASVIVQALNHGLQLSVGVFLPFTGGRFDVPFIDAGQLFLNMHFLGLLDVTFS